MGVIKRQGIKQSIVTYLGVVLGVISTLWIYPLDLEIYGFSQVLMAMATILVPFASLGIAHVSVKFFPQFDSIDKNENGFLGFLLSFQLFWFLIFTGIFFTFKDPLLSRASLLGFDRDLVEQNLYSILILCFLTVFIILIMQYTSNFKRIVIPAILNNLIAKIALPVLVVLFYLQYIDVSQFKFIYLGLFAAILIGLFAYLLKLNKLNVKIRLKHLNGRVLKDMFNYASFSMFSSLGTAISMRIDAIMVAMLLGLTETGIYSMALFISNVIEIPYKSIKSISTPIISQNWSSNNKEEINSIYQKASVNLLYIGSLIFLMIWCSIDEIFTFTGKHEILATGKNVVLFLGLAKLTDMTLGLNTQIISMSKYYRYNLFVLLILSIINLVANYYLIPVMGIEGAALATLISIVIYNLLTFGFLYMMYKMQPFSLKTVKILLLASITYIIILFIPETGMAFIDLTVKSFVIGVIYLVALLNGGISDDLKSTLTMILKKANIRIN